MDAYIKYLLGFGPHVSDRRVRAEWQRRTKNVCKPCWEVKYCPYGPLVEDFPLLPPTRAEAIEHNHFLTKQLAAGAYDRKRHRELGRQVREFNPRRYPVAHKRSDVEKSCTVFGHMCPVFFVNEPLTETQELRRVGPHIPRSVMLRVVRRDNNQCQMCGKLLRDNEIEFDHIIPRSRGGSSEEHNLRVACMECNRTKGAHCESWPPPV
jgi:hypothetical protein